MRKEKRGKEAQPKGNFNHRHQSLCSQSQVHDFDGAFDGTDIGTA